MNGVNSPRSKGRECDDFQEIRVVQLKISSAVAILSRALKLRSGRIRFGVAPQAQISGFPRAVLLRGYRHACGSERNLSLEFELMMLSSKRGRVRSRPRLV